MAFAARRILRGTIVTIACFVALAGVASAAFQRPNQLDRRVDALPAQTLMSQPASRLVDPDRQAAANRLAALTLPGWIVMTLFQAGALAYFWRSGGAAALRGRLRRRFVSRWTVRFSFGACLALIARLAALVPSFYLFRVERTMNLSVALTRTWGALWIFHTLLAMLVAGLIAALVLWLVDRTHQWYAYTIVIILGACIAWSYASPYFQVPPRRQTEPLTGSVRASIDRALARGGIFGVPIFVEKAPASPESQAVVVGLGGFRRVVLTRVAVKAETDGEIAYRATYAIGHAIHADPLFAGLIEGGIIIIFAAIAVVLADRIGFRRDDDSLSRFALLGALLALVYLGAVPVRNAALRNYDLDADRYAVSLTADRAGAIRAIVRETDQRMEEVCPGTPTMLFLVSRPSPSVRVAAMNGVAAPCR